MPGLGPACSNAPLFTFHLYLPRIGSRIHNYFASAVGSKPIVAEEHGENTQFRGVTFFSIACDCVVRPG